MELEFGREEVEHVFIRDLKGKTYVFAVRTISGIWEDPLKDD